MAQRQLELSCARFRKDLSAEDDKAIRTTSLDDVRAAIAQIETELASRQSLRNFDRLSPYINAIERYGKVIEVFCNSDPLVPYIWAPVKFIILAVKEQTQALDQILGAYAQIGNALPRLSAVQQSFKDDRDFQILFAFLYDDITEFHRRVYRFIRRSAWPIMFSSSWSRFERRFGALITNITKISDLVDKQATTYHILEVKEWRQKSLEDSEVLETRRTTEQSLAVLDWLGAEVQSQKDKLDRLNDRSHEGTSTWIAKHTKFRSWLQRGRGSPVLWIHGKPGSGKSVLVSQVVSFIPTDPKSKVRVLFFFCDYRTPAHQVTTQIFRAYLAQYISQDPDIVPFIYDEYVAKGLSPVAKVLKPALIAVSKSADVVRLILDGLDEIEAAEHKTVLRELKRLTEVCGDTCKLLVASQDVPSIRSLLGKTPQIFLGAPDERQAIETDMRVVVEATLTELDEGLDWALAGDQKAALQASILSNAEGMFLWINLILSLLEEAGSVGELESIVTTLPKNLEQMYARLLDRIRSRCDSHRLSRVSRIFEWLLFAEKKDHISKYDVLLGSTFHEECTTLDRKNIPFPTALDICKPLIEDGPGGTVAFIHSTLPYFLAKSKNGPLLSPRIGHEHIAFACVSHLIHILEFVQPEVKRQKKIEAVGLGCLGLQRYASQHWVSHILNYLNETDHPEISSDVPLIAQLLQLTTAHNILLKTVGPRIDDDDQVMAPTPALQKLDPFPETYDLLTRVLSFQDSFSAKQLVEGPNILAVDSDKTLFSLANSNHSAVVELLLKASTSIGLTEAELVAFKAQFGGTAFVCPVKGCTQAFASEPELNNHKSQRHKQRLRCYQGKCTYNDVGFANTASLQQHVRKVHKKETPRIPTAIKRRKIEDHEPPVLGHSDTADTQPLDELPHPLDTLQGGAPHRNPIDNTGDEPNFKRLAVSHKKAKDDWFVVFNPTVPRHLDVDLAHTLPHDSVVCCVRFSMDGKFIATGCQKLARIYDVTSGEMECELENNSGVAEDRINNYTRAVCFSPDGKYLVTGSEDKLIRLWDIASRTISNIFVGHEADVYSLDFSRDSRTIVSGGADNTVRLWDIDTSSSVLNLPVGNFVAAVAISPDCQLIAAGCQQDDSVHVWNIQGDVIDSLGGTNGHNEGIYGIAFHPDSKQVISGSLDKTIKIWELDLSGQSKTDQARTRGRCIQTLEGHRDFVISVAITPDARWVLSSSKDRGVQFWDPETGNTQLMVQGHKNSVISVSTSPTGMYFATGSGDERVRIWKYTNLALR